MQVTTYAFMAHMTNIQKFSFFLYNLVKRDFTLKYRRSILGVLWSVLNPLMMMAVMTTVFQHIFRFQIEDYPVYYLTGSLIFNFMSEATTGSMRAMVGSADLLKKVYIPKYIFPLEKSLFALLNSMFAFIACLVVMPVIGFTPRLTSFLFFLPMFYTFIFSLGLGMILATVNVFFRDMEHLYSVFIQAWVFLTPIVYPVDALPEVVQAVSKLNPMYYFVDTFRMVMLYGQIPPLQRNINCIIISFSALLMGLAIFKRTQDKFILYV